MQPAEIIHVETQNVACDGGGGPLGHPMVYLTMESGARIAGGQVAQGQVDCPYCGRRFVLDAKAAGLDAKPAGLDANATGSHAHA
jgi:uncharacterized Zn-finger protein